jgi:hypothetical protein
VLIVLSVLLGASGVRSISSKRQVSEQESKREAAIPINISTRKFLKECISWHRQFQTVGQRIL